MIRLKRVYEPAAAEDGFRILVDRLWPRGLSKEKAQVDLWLREIAPSAELRRWFGHDPAKWTEFQRRYQVELAANVAATRQLRDVIRGHSTATLVYAARDEEHNDAVVLQHWLNR